MNKKLIKWFLQIIATIILLYLALRKIDTEAIKSILNNTNFTLFLFIPLFLMADLLINSYRIQSLYRFYGIKTELKKIALIKLEGGFFSLIFPLVGDAYKIQTFKNNYGASYGKNSLVVLLDRLIFTFALTVILAPVWLFGIIEVAPVFQWSIAALLLFEILILFLLNNPAIFKHFSKLLLRIHPGLYFFAIKFNARQGYSREMLINTIIAIARHMLTAMMYLIIAVSVLPHRDFSTGLFLLTVFSIILSRVLPVSVGGIGLREYIAVAVFPQIGIIPEYAFTIALTVSLIGILQGMAGGISFLWNRIHVFSKIINKNQE